MADDMKARSGISQAFGRQDKGGNLGSHNSGVGGGLNVVRSLGAVRPVHHNHVDSLEIN